jgi:hypothetical protein
MLLESGLTRLKYFVRSNIYLVYPQCPDPVYLDRIHVTAFESTNFPSSVDILHRAG